jgi:hypothetical protein
MQSASVIDSPVNIEEKANMPKLTGAVLLSMSVISLASLNTQTSQQPVSVNKKSVITISSNDYGYARVDTSHDEVVLEQKYDAVATSSSKSSSSVNFKPNFSPSNETDTWS